VVASKYLGVLLFVAEFQFVFVLLISVVRGVLNKKLVNLLFLSGVFILKVNSYFEV
jgi:hypothetical protein